MTDLELLECAAEAMHNLKDPNFCNYSVVDGKVGVCLDLGSRRGAITSYWNPLTNDGDALRLAVKLGLMVYVMVDAGFTGIRLPGEHIGGKYDEVELHLGLPEIATRRAIVRAAAEIGKQIEGGQHGTE